MKQIINTEDRGSIVKLVAISVCALELLITLLTLVYQQDVVKHIETPITHEMAQDYIDHPDKLKSNERLTFNAYGSMSNQRTYFLVKDLEEVVPFPWKAWILISIGAPIGLAFLIVLLTRAYFQAVAPEESAPAESSGRFVSALNRLSQINIIWFMLSAFVVVFLFWYVPELIKYTGGVAMIWLTRYWWIPAILLCIAVAMVWLWIYLQYRLKVKAMGMEMELAKFKFMQLESNNRLLIERGNGLSDALPEQTQAETNNEENSRQTDILDTAVALDASGSLESMGKP